MPGSFAVLARRCGALVGYALIVVQDGPDETWATGDRIAEVESLSVLPSERGHGIGGKLMDAVDSELSDQGVRDVQLAVVATNAKALRFYTRRGLMPRLVVLSNYQHAASFAGGDDREE